MKLRKVARLIESFRVGRDIPLDLYGKPVMDQTIAIVTDALDKWFAVLDESVYDDSHAATSVAQSLRLVLDKRELLCEDEFVAQLTFRNVGLDALPSWQPGMHLDLELPSGRTRQYSLCGDSSDVDTYTIAVRLIPSGGGGSVEMHSLDIGTELAARGPRNGFPFVPSGSALFIAGGIGITAILPMVRFARQVGMDWHLFYAGRTRAALPFLDEIGSWEPARVTLWLDDEHGFPATADLLDKTAVGGAVYCCGPPPMIDKVREGFDESPATHLYFERFSPPPVKDGVSFEVQLVDSGTVLEVAADRTALQVIREVRPDIAYSCQQGFCGTCRVTVLNGRPDHRESRLTAEEQQREMLICVSRANGGRLVLDM